MAGGTEGRRGGGGTEDLAELRARVARLEQEAAVREEELHALRRGVTERRATEEAAARLAAIVGSAEDAIVSHDLDGVVTSWNEGATRVFGYSADEMVGRTFEHMIPADRRDLERELVARIVGGERVARFEARRLRRDGRAIDVAVTFSPIVDREDRVVGISRIARDVTERKRAELRLREMLGFNQKIVEASWIGLVVFRADGPCVVANEAAARILGATVDQLHAQSFPEIRSWRDSGLYGLAMETLDTGESRRAEVSVRTTFGRDAWIEAALSRFHNAGSPHLLVLINDITERKNAEAELSRSNADLEQFAFVASHDLKAPLRAIDSIARWLEEDLAPTLRDENRRHLQLLRQRTARMERLLDDLLEYSRAGRVTADVRRVDVAELVEEIADSLGPPPGFVVAAVPPLPVFAAPRTVLHQIFVNLINNAVKHHDRAEGRIEVAAREAGSAWEFTVRDDGPGIPPQYHERIFGMFETLRPRDEVEGSGIGLAVVRRLVERYGGHIGVECEGPRGSTFRFTWPRAVADEGGHRG